MLVIKIELWPWGDESRKKKLGEAHLWNDGTGDIFTGNYKFKTLEPEEEEGEVKNHPRLAKNVWDLLYLALKAAVGYRNK